MKTRTSGRTNKVRGIRSYITTHDIHTYKEFQASIPYTCPTLLNEDVEEDEEEKEGLTEGEFSSEFSSSQKRPKNEICNFKAAKFLLCLSTNHTTYAYSSYDKWSIIPICMVCGLNTLSRRT